MVSDEAVKLTDVSEEISKLISEIGERYGIVSPITARRLTGGYANDVFRLDADGPPTVFAPQAPTGRRRQPGLGAPALGTAEQPPAGGARTGRRLWTAQPGSGFTTAPFG